MLFAMLFAMIAMHIVRLEGISVRGRSAAPDPENPLAAQR
jgi:hypothetical protein